MSHKLATALLALVSVGLAGAPFAYAQKVVAPTSGTVGRAAAPAQPEADTRSALATANAEAAAILDALKKDPALAGELAKNPSGGGALLRSRGAGGGSGGTVEIGPTTGSGAARTFTITIKIRDITIIITIKI